MPWFCFAVGIAATHSGRSGAKSSASGLALFNALSSSKVPTYSASQPKTSTNLKHGRTYLDNLKAGKGGTFAPHGRSAVTAVAELGHDLAQGFRLHIPEVTGHTVAAIRSLGMLLSGPLGHFESCFWIHSIG